MHRLIFHVDVNSAFLSWSAVKKLREEPGSVDLRTIPSAVGGDINTRHGVITAKSIPAKKYGIRTGEPVVKALQKCPGLVLVQADFRTYREYSRAFIEILKRYSPMVEQVSIDEAYLDMTEAAPASDVAPGRAARDNVEETPVRTKDREPWYLAAARAIRDEIRTTLGFTVNVGISTNKLLAKTASDFTKPDRTHTLFPEEIPEKFWPLPIGDLYGCGPASAEKLTDMGIRTVRDAASTDLRILQSALGDKAGTYIWNSARGRGSDRVRGERQDAKGYSNETTTAADIDENNYDTDMKPVLEKLADSVSARLARDGVYASTIGVTAKTDDFRRHSRQMTLPDSTSRQEDFRTLSGLLMRQLCFGPDGLFAKGKKIRLVGVSAGNLDRGDFRQVSLEDWAKENHARKRDRTIPEEKRRRLDEMVRKVREQYGDRAISKGPEEKKTV